MPERGGGPQLDITGPAFGGGEPALTPPTPTPDTPTVEQPEPTPPPSDPRKFKDPPASTSEPVETSEPEQVRHSWLDRVRRRPPALPSQPKPEETAGPAKPDADKKGVLDPQEEANLVMLERERELYKEAISQKYGGFKNLFRTNILENFTNRLYLVRNYKLENFRSKMSKDMQAAVNTAENRAKVELTESEKAILEAQKNRLDKSLNAVDQRTAEMYYDLNNRTLYDKLINAGGITAKAVEVLAVGTFAGKVGAAGLRRGLNYALHYSVLGGAAFGGIMGGYHSNEAKRQEIMSSESLIKKYQELITNPEVGPVGALSLLQAEMQRGRVAHGRSEVLKLNTFFNEEARRQLFETNLSKALPEEINTLPPAERQVEVDRLFQEHLADKDGWDTLPKPTDNASAVTEAGKGEPTPEQPDERYHRLFDLLHANLSKRDKQTEFGIADQVKTLEREQGGQLRRAAARGAVAGALAGGAVAWIVGEVLGPHHNGPSHPSLHHATGTVSGPETNAPSGSHPGPTISGAPATEAAAAGHPAGPTVDHGGITYNRETNAYQVADRYRNAGKIELPGTHESYFANVPHTPEEIAAHPELAGHAVNWQTETGAGMAHVVEEHPDAFSGLPAHNTPEFSRILHVIKTLQPADPKQAAEQQSKHLFTFTHDQIQAAIDKAKSPAMQPLPTSEIYQQAVANLRQAIYTAQPETAASLGGAPADILRQQIEQSATHKVTPLEAASLAGLTSLLSRPIGEAQRYLDGVNERKRLPAKQEVGNFQAGVYDVNRGLVADLHYLARQASPSALLQINHLAHDAKEHLVQSWLGKQIQKQTNKEIAEQPLAAEIIRQAREQFTVLAAEASVGLKPFRYTETSGNQTHTRVGYIDKVDDSSNQPILTMYEYGTGHLTQIPANEINRLQEMMELPGDLTEREVQDRLKLGATEPLSLRPHLLTLQTDNVYLLLSDQSGQQTRPAKIVNISQNGVYLSAREEDYRTGSPSNQDEFIDFRKPADRARIHGLTNPDKFYQYVEKEGRRVDYLKLLDEIDLALNSDDPSKKQLLGTLFTMRDQGAIISSRALVERTEPGKGGRPKKVNKVDLTDMKIRRIELTDQTGQPTHNLSQAYGLKLDLAVVNELGEPHPADPTNPDLYRKTIEAGSLQSIREQVEHLGVRLSRTTDLQATLNQIASAQNPWATSAAAELKQAVSSSTNIAAQEGRPTVFEIKTGRRKVWARLTSFDGKKLTFQAIQRGDPGKLVEGGGTKDTIDLSQPNQRARILRAIQTGL